MAVDKRGKPCPTDPKEMCRDLTAAFKAWRTWGQGVVDAVIANRKAINELEKAVCEIEEHCCHGRTEKPIEACERLRRSLKMLMVRDPDPPPKEPDWD